MSVPAKYPALTHTQKVLDELTAGGLPSGQHTLLLVSHETPMRNDTDREMPHRQESNFFYLTGCDIPGSALTVEFSVPASSDGFKHTLYIPDTDPEAIMWSIPPPSIDEVVSTLETQTVLHLPLPSSLSSTASTIHTLPPTVLFPTLPTPILSASPSSDHLLPAIHRARLVKTPFEVALMTRAAEITSHAHEVVMRELGKFAGGRGVAGKGGRAGEARAGGLGLNEWEIESEGDAVAVFAAVCRRAGSKHLAYMPIMASGMRAATLHYICNHSPFTPLESGKLPTSLTSSAFTAAAPSAQTNGHSHHTHDHASGAPDHTHSDALDLTSLKSDWKPQVLLIDAGTEFSCYGADITRTMPVGNGGKFTQEAGEIYELVLKMQKDTEKFCAPGVHWDEVHLLAHRILVQGFLKLGIFVGDEETVLNSGVSAAFYPHGLGHSLGLDVHDVPSASKPTPNSTIPTASIKQTPELYAYLRLRLPLEVGMIVTIEPGCYFSPHLLAPIRSSPHINHDVLARYESVGGVRIEDVVVVEEGGVRNLTPAVRERADVERLCSGN